MLRILVQCALAVLVSGCAEPAPPQDRETPGAAEQGRASADEQTASLDSSESTGVVPLFALPRRNKYVQLSVVEAGFDSTGPTAPAGQRNYTVGLRGTSVSRTALFELDIQRFVFAQNERGCISRPETNATWLKKPFGSTGKFSTPNPTEGQLAFLVPEDTQRIRVLIAPASDGGLVLPVGEDFTPNWPSPVRVIEDGTTLRLLVLPSPSLPEALTQPANGREHIVLDLVIENLRTDQGIEFTTSQQIRLIDPAGTFVQPSPLTQQFGCRLEDGEVIPPGHARRLMAVYDMPSAKPRRLQYRGFEVDEVTIDLE